MNYEEFMDRMSDLLDEKDEIDERITQLRELRLKELIPYENGDTVTIQFTKKFAPKWGQEYNKGDTITGVIGYPELTLVGRNAKINIRSDFDDYAYVATDKFKFITKDE